MPEPTGLEAPGGDQDLIQRARRGEPDAWRTIYRSLAPSVTGYLRAKGAPEPEDLAGEVFLQVVRDIHRFEGESSEFRSWVFVIAHHRMLDDSRSRKRRPVQPAQDEVITRAGPVGDVAAEAESLVAESEMRDLLDLLTEEQRTVVLLRVFGGMKIEEVAKAMGKRPGAVQALQRRGLESLKREMGRRGVGF